jgi:hypothetical protein
MNELTIIYWLLLFTLSLVAFVAMLRIFTISATLKELLELMRKHTGIVAPPTKRNTWVD